MSPFAVEQSYRYDLYAVSNHMGSMSGGHYTAYCRHPINRDWCAIAVGVTSARCRERINTSRRCFVVADRYCFDDARVSKVSERDIVSPHAYVLYYEKRR